MAAGGADANDTLSFFFVFFTFFFYKIKCLRCLLQYYSRRLMIVFYVHRIPWLYTAWNMYTSQCQQYNFVLLEPTEKNYGVLIAYIYYMDFMHRGLKIVSYDLIHAYEKEHNNKVFTILDPWKYASSAWLCNMSWRKLMAMVSLCLCCRFSCSWCYFCGLYCCFWCLRWCFRCAVSKITKSALVKDERIKAFALK